MSEKPPVEPATTKEEPEPDKMPEEHVEIADPLDAELEKLLLTEPLQGLTKAQVDERILQFGRNGMHHSCALNIVRW